MMTWKKKQLDREYVLRVEDKIKRALQLSCYVVTDPTVEDALQYRRQCLLTLLLKRALSSKPPLFLSTYV